MVVLCCTLPDVCELVCVVCNVLLGVPCLLFGGCNCLLVVAWCAICVVCRVLFVFVCWVLLVVWCLVFAVCCLVLLDVCWLCYDVVACCAMRFVRCSLFVVRCVLLGGWCLCFVCVGLLVAWCCSLLRVACWALSAMVV